MTPKKGMERLGAKELSKLRRYIKLENIPQADVEDFGLLVDRRITELAKPPLIDDVLLLIEPTLSPKYSKAYLSPTGQLMIIGSKGASKKEVKDRIAHELTHIKKRLVVGKQKGVSEDFARAKAELRVYQAEKESLSKREWLKILPIRRRDFRTYWAELSPTEKDKLIKLTRAILSKPKDKTRRIFRVGSKQRTKSDIRLAGIRA